MNLNHIALVLRRILWPFYLPSPHEAAGFIFEAWLLRAPAQIELTVLVRLFGPAELFGSALKIQCRDRMRPFSVRPLINGPPLRLLPEFFCIFRSHSCSRFAQHMRRRKRTITRQVYDSATECRFGLMNCPKLWRDAPTLKSETGSQRRYCSKSAYSYSWCRLIR